MQVLRKDVFFMALIVLKHCGRWDIVAHVFKIKSTTFEKMIVNFLKVLSSHLYEIYVDAGMSEWPAEKVLLSGNAFVHYPSARYATDVTFQQTNMPSGIQAERAHMCSAKHKLHDFKVDGHRSNSIVGASAG